MNIAFLRLLSFERNDGFALALAPQDMLVPVQGVKRAPRGQFPHIHWEIRLRHKRGYKLLNGGGVQAGSEEIDACLWFVQRIKKRQANQMVAMSVCNKKRDIERAARAAAQKIMAQSDDTAARVQDDGLRADLDFNTACVAPVAY